MTMIHRISLLLLFTASATLQVSQAQLFKPYQISYDDLLAGHVSPFGLVQALTERGMVAISDMAVDDRLLRTQHSCLLEQAVQMLTAPDGTVRYTLATQTTPSVPASSSVVGGKKALPFFNKEDATSPVSTVCQEFNEAAAGLRINVQAAVQAFASVLDLALGLVSHQDGQEGEVAGTASASTLTGMVQHGTHLEHFHSYVKPMTAGQVLTISPEGEDEEPATLDWHVDQGVFLAFMPGRYETKGDITRGFYIRQTGPHGAVGAAQEVDFAGASLVFMLGDGINRYIQNNKYQQQLRPLQHALRVPVAADGQARIWFGLMVLPPASALITTSQQGPPTTFGAIRNGLVQMHPDSFALGCSQGVATAVSGTPVTAAVVSRTLAENVGSAPANNKGAATEESGSNPSISSNLEEMNCPAADQVYCWHRCMNLTEYALTHEMCEGKKQLVSCLNPRGQLSDGDQHGDFFLACAAADTPVVTDFPTLPDYPRDDDLCNDFDAFVKAESYDYSMTLEGGNGAVLQWNVVTVAEGNMAKKKIKGRLAFNGIFGYLSIGKSGSGGRNKMYNAPVIFALRGSNYTPQTGFELDTEPYIAEYITAGNTTSYRFWTEMEQTIGASYETSYKECFTDLKFSTSSIAGVPLNIGGTDEMIWAANDVDTFAQYHGENRAVFNITWEDSSLSSSSSSGSTSVVTVVSMVAILAGLVAAFN